MTGHVCITSEGKERFVYYMTSGDFRAGSGEDPSMPDMVRFWKDHDIRTVFMLDSDAVSMAAGSFIRKRMFSLGFMVREIQIPYPDAGVFDKYASLCLSLYRELKTGGVLILSREYGLVQSVLSAFLVSLGMSADRALGYLGRERDSDFHDLHFFLSVYASFLIKPASKKKLKKPVPSRLKPAPVIFPEQKHLLPQEAALPELLFESPGEPVESIEEFIGPPVVPGEPSAKEPVPAEKIQLLTKEEALEIIKTDEKKPAPEKVQHPSLPAQAGVMHGPVIQAKGRRMSIRFKLTGIVSVIILCSLSFMIFLATYFFKQDNKIRIEEKALKLSEVLARKVSSDLESVLEKSSILARLGTGQSEQSRMIRDVLLKDEKNLIAVSLITRGDETAKVSVVNTLFNEVNRDEKRYNRDDIERAISVSGAQLARSFDGDYPVVNISSMLDVPAFVLAAPFEKRGDRFHSALVITYSLGDWIRLFSARGNMISFLVNEAGEVLVHPDVRLVINGENVRSLPVVDQMLKSRIDNGFSLFSDHDNVRFFGSFKKVGFGAMGVISTVEEKRAMEEVFNIQRRNIYIMIIMLNIAIIVVVYFSRTLTDPIYKLVQATKEIQEGNFSVSIDVKANDELADLARSFESMGQGLGEREKIKDAFGKFVNKDLADMLLKGDVKLGGERKEVVIMFTDIRSFTDLSERFEPETVVEFLNRYFTEMVSCIYLTGGIVDKYIGDAIMAVWGTPVSSGNDVEMAVNAALVMRRTLVRFNLKRGGADNPVINMGCGINSGPVIAGQIGSADRMEYTVIGDTVNLASRIEALNKPFRTDIIISAKAYNAVKDIFEVKKLKQVRVKGKRKEQDIYAVLGRFDDETRPRTLDELRKRIRMDMSVPVCMDDADGEVKYEILDS